MKSISRLMSTAPPLLLAGVLSGGPAIAIAPAGSNIAKLDSLRLIGKARYENDDFAAAAETFRRCIELAPETATGYFNLGLTLMRGQKYDEALVALDRAAQIDPKLLAPRYVKGIILKRQGDFEGAIRELRHVTEHDDRCWGACYNLAVCHKYLQQYPEAMRAMAAALRIDPRHPSGHYQMITLARRVGDVELAKRHREIFDQIKGTVDESQKTVEALERSRYAYIIEVEPQADDLAAAPMAGIRFVHVTDAAGLEPREATGESDAGPTTADGDPVRALAARVGGAVALHDCDGDGDLDLYVVNCTADGAAAANRLYRNDGTGHFTDVTEAAGVGDRGLGQAAAWGDYDNDGLADLYVINCGRNVLYHNRGDGTFEDVSKAAGVDEPHFGRDGVLVDYDHDNDLDLIIANELDPAEHTSTPGNAIGEDVAGQFNTLLRNNGDGTFSDRTDEAGLLVELARTRAVLFADFESDQDTDLLFVNADTPSALFLNDRMGQLSPGGTFDPPLGSLGKATAAAEGDLNRDGRMDLLVAAGGTLHLYLNRGPASFAGTPVPLPPGLAAGAARIVVLDANNDGWPDLLLLGADGRSLALLGGGGDGRFRDGTAAVGLDGAVGPIAAIAAGDLDGDGDQDVILHDRGRGPRLLRNDGPGGRHWLAVRLVGKKVNRGGHAATVEVAAGGHYQKQTVRTGRVHFGLGELTAVDVVRVMWPNGVAQNIVRPELDGTLTIEEHVRVSASCGFLYAHDGHGFKLINEILGIGPLGVPMAPGAYHQPDCTELTLLEPHQLLPRDGRYELRLTEELRETMYLDAARLRVVDHPPDLEVVPNEMFRAPPFPEDRFFAFADPRPPTSAVDDTGRGLLELIRHRDGRVPTFALTPYEGLAAPHSLTLDLGDLDGARQIFLCLDGWIHWPESSTVIAIAQDQRFELMPLSLAVPDAAGRWQTLEEGVGLPTSKGLVVPVELTGRFPCRDYRVRLSTTLCVYFDRIFVATADRASDCRVTVLPARAARLHYRGFSRMSRDPLGYERFHYDQVTTDGPWNQARGLHTRYGDVRQLLTAADDMYVIFGPGDELALQFDATAVPPSPSGWRRSFIFYANGWVKDGDLNTALSATVEPLPFHAMSAYPYPPTESYPVSPTLDRYRRTWNTRPARVTVGTLSVTE